MTVTIRDVARVSGVSIKTVSNVVHGRARMRPETRARVLEVIEDLGYRPNLSARQLRSGRSGMIGLIVPDLRNAYFAELADSVMRVAATRGLAVVIQPVGGGREQELATLRSPHKHMVDGIIYSALNIGQEDLDVLRDADTPVVVLGDIPFAGQVDRITIANVEGGYAASNHLLERGRRRILVLGANDGDSVATADLRLQGYRRALGQHEIAFDEELVRFAATWTRAGGAEEMEACVADGVVFDAVFALNDALALGAMRVLQQAGRVVPDDVAIVGFDDIEEAQFSLPSLTSVNPGRDQVAAAAVDRLLLRIAGSEEHLDSQEVRAGLTLVERESSRL